MSGILFNNCLSQAEGSYALNVAELSDWDPDGLGPCPSGVLEAGHHASGGAIAGAVVQVSEFTGFAFLSA